MSESPASIQQRDRLSDAEVHDVLHLIDDVAAADGAVPISEHVMLHLRHGGDEHDIHFIARVDDTIVGYLHLDTTDAVEGASAELAVAPEFRRRGIGSGLVRQAMQAYSGRHFRLWAHGEDHGAHALAQSLGFSQSRRLLQMRRSLFAELPRLPLPEGLVLRSFVHPDDEAAWLEVNNRAFDAHPEQGRWSEDDLGARIQENWFDATGFLLAVSADDTSAIAGFHWTKVHGGSRHSHGEAPAHTHAPIGEVYVLGVDPDWRGSGLGRALTVAGLQYLRSLGLDQAMLYVDADNSSAVGLYESLGFTKWDSDVQYRRTS